MTAAALELTPSQRRDLERVARATSLPYRQVIAARCVLLASDGVPTADIARHVGSTAGTVRRWLARFATAGLDGLGDVAPGRGRKRAIRDGVADAIMSDTLGPPPEGCASWTLRALAERHGVSKDTVARVWQERGLQAARAHSRRTEGAARPQQVPGGEVNTVLAALDVATGQALSRCRPHESHRDFLFFVKLVEAIELWVDHWDDPSRPFAWPTREDLVQHTKRAKSALASYGNLATRSGTRRW